MSFSKSDLCSRICYRVPTNTVKIGRISAGPLRGTRPTPSALVLRLRRVDLVDPFQDSAAQVLDVREANRLQELLRLGAAAAHLALRDDLAILRQLLIAPRQLAQRNQRRAGDLVDLVFVRLAHVEDERLF